MPSTKFLDALAKLSSATVGVLLALIVVITFYGVVMRYVFYMPQAWAMEIPRIAFVWLVMLGASVITQRKEHIGMTFFLDLLPQPLKFVWSLIVHLAMLWFCWVLIEQGMDIFPQVAVAKTPTLNLSMVGSICDTAGGRAHRPLYRSRTVRLIVEKAWRREARGGKSC